MKWRGSIRRIIQAARLRRKRKVARTKMYHKILANIGNKRTVFYKDKYGDTNAVYGRLVRLARGHKNHLYLWVNSKFSTQIDFDDITSVEP